MTSNKWLLVCVSLITATALTSCKVGNKNSQTASDSANKSAGPSSATQPDKGETGIEKVKPAPGTGNVQGKILYNDKPVENIEVKLCEKFSQFIGGCSGKSYTARTDKEGVYVIANVEPKVYEGLSARVFDTDSYVFATTGIAGISSTQYEISPDKTLFIRPTHLFKSDLKTLNPKAGAKVSAQNLELRWEPYPDAAYYKFSVYPEDTNITSPYVNERVEGTTFTVNKPLQNGTYRWQVEAFSNADRKLSESSSDIKFTITDGAAP
ncbi:MAG TPA: hypothetical protein DCK93_04245 [Blastocatellia bacterium]|nr:hypothetical protein [Blastocatellia bacterium]